MAWLVKTRTAPIYTPSVETTPSSKVLNGAQAAYAASHPELSRFQFAWTQRGVHLPRDLLPVSARVKSKHKSLPDAIPLFGLGFSEKLKNLVEELEPGVHQFVEVSVTLKSGEPAAARYYATVLGRMADNQVVLEQSTISTRMVNDRVFMNAPLWTDHDSIAITRRDTVGWHIWFSIDVFQALTVSDELRERMIAAKVDCFEYLRLKEV